MGKMVEALADFEIGTGSILVPLILITSSSSLVVRIFQSGCFFRNDAQIDGSYRYVGEIEATFVSLRY